MHKYGGQLWNAGGTPEAETCHKVPSVKEKEKGWLAHGPFYPWGTQGTGLLQGYF